MDPSPMTQSLIVERQEISDTTNDDGENVNSFKSEYLTYFEPVAFLGEGGSGMVFEAKKKFDGYNYAIKRIDLFGSPHTEEKIMREVKTLAKLDHPNIVRYFNSWLEWPPSGWQEEHDQQWVNDPGCSADSLSESQTETIDVSQTNQSSVDTDHSESIVFKETDNNIVTEKEECKRKSPFLDLNKKSAQVFLYIQMQLCQSSLDEWLKEHTERDICEVLNIFAQIVDAVEYVHSHGLIHRDLKPSNIFFAYDGKDKIKVGDFGLVSAMPDDCNKAHAPVAENENVSLKNKVHSTCVGTDEYMSPEIGEPNYDYKVDIYSLGIILFELLTPFSTEMERIATLPNLKQSIFPKCFVERYPAEHNLVKMMLSEDPIKRPTILEIKNFKLLQNYEKSFKDISPKNVDRKLIYPLDLSFLKKIEKNVTRPVGRETRRVFRQIRKVIR